MKHYVIQTNLPTEIALGNIQYSFRNISRIRWQLLNGQIIIAMPEEDIIVNEIKGNISLILGEGSYLEETATVLQENDEILLKELPITKDKRITLYPHHLMRMQILLINECTAPWYYCNFINIPYVCGHYYDYTDNDSFYHRIFDASYLSSQELIQYNHIDIFINNINHNNYIYVLIDNKYISTSRHYQKEGWHDVHHILIYGYDLKTKNICALSLIGLIICNLLKYLCMKYIRQLIMLDFSENSYTLSI